MKHTQSPRASRARTIDWHSGFDAALPMELREWRDGLEFLTEPLLNSRPIRPDMVIIRKDPSLTIGNPIGRIFRTYNIIEYKNPTDTMNLDTLYKTFGYACLYKAGHEAGRTAKPAGEITVSLIRQARPDSLLRAVRAEGGAIAKVSEGIYHLSGAGFPFQTQVVVCRELPEEGHLYLKALSPGGDGRILTRLLGEAQGASPEDLERIRSVMQVFLSANESTFTHWKEEHQMLTDEEIMYMFFGDRIEAQMKENEAKLHEKDAKIRSLMEGMEALEAQNSVLGEQYSALGAQYNALGAEVAALRAKLEENGIPV